MYFQEIYHRYRHNEPKPIVACRGITAFLIISLLVTFLAFLIVDIRDDEPVLQKTMFEAESLPIPALTAASQDNLSAYIKQPIMFDKYWIAFLSFDNIKRFNPENNLVILITIKIDSTYNTTTLSAITFEAYDPEFGPYRHKIDNYAKFREDYGRRFTYSLTALNRYYIYTIKEIIPRKQSNAFGIPASYSKETYLTSTFEPDYSQAELFDAKEYAVIDIRPRSYMVERFREQRSKTFLVGLGLFGGVWVIATGVYACLFGTNALQPWGLIHRYCFPNYNNNHIRTRFPTIPLLSSATNRNFPTTNNPESDDAIRSRLEQRINVLELFLKDYVVNAGYLENFVRNANNANQPLSGGTSMLQQNPLPPYSQQPDASSNLVQTRSTGAALSTNPQSVYVNQLPASPGQEMYLPQGTHNLQGNQIVNLQSTGLSSMQLYNLQQEP
ncbi:13619_t:CDS:2 [Ambispora gerdemannii]|uniref:13619_t:CDS:1 n=1 Tax=Ambispora gerdemannii TaxID=144530 RepID=A0A9N9GD61_9GLOM|nr:13619_t:CDS:2 [Ambispora gerdemannii]